MRYQEASHQFLTTKSREDFVERAERYFRALGYRRKVDGAARLRFVRGDVGDATLVEGLFAEEGFGGVLHLAALCHAVVRRPRVCERESGHG